MRTIKQTRPLLMIFYVDDHGPENEHVALRVTGSQTPVDFGECEEHLLYLYLY